VDRSLEHLGTSDTAIIQVRKRLMGAARALRERGTPPPGQNPASFNVRSASVILPAGESWIEAARELIAPRPGQSLILV